MLLFNEEVASKFTSSVSLIRLDTLMVAALLEAKLTNLRSKLIDIEKDK